MPSVTEQFSEPFSNGRLVRRMERNQMTPDGRDGTGERSRYVARFVLAFDGGWSPEIDAKDRKATGRGLSS